MYKLNINVKEVTRFTGILLIIFILLANPLVIEQIYSPDKEFDSILQYVVMLLFDITVFLLGLYFSFKPQTSVQKFRELNIYVRKKKRCISICLVSIIIMMLLFELILRFCLFSPICDIPGFNEPISYTGSTNEDFWKLVNKISGPEDAIESGFILIESDPMTGWDYIKNKNMGCYKTDNNRAQVYESRFDKSPCQILFFGDSFVQGMSPGNPTQQACSNNTVAARLEDAVGIDTLNLGVIAYGFGQIFLKFNSTYKSNNSIILIGLLHEDLDRVALEEMPLGKKPHFEFVGDEINKDVRIFLPEEVHPDRDPRIKSYLWNRFYYSNIGHLFFSKFYRAEQEAWEKKVKDINEEIFDMFLQVKDQEDLEVNFVLFYRDQLLQTETWRQKFVNKLLNEHNITYFDTKKYLLEYSIRNNITLSDFYIPEDGHLNHLGNTVIADGISSELNRTSLYTSCIEK